MKAWTKTARQKYAAHKDKAGLAKLCGVSRQSLSGYAHSGAGRQEGGADACSRRRAAPLAHLLGIPARQFGQEGDEHPRKGPRNHRQRSCATLTRSGRIATTKCSGTSSAASTTFTTGCDSVDGGRPFLSRVVKVQRGRQTKTAGFRSTKSAASASCAMRGHGSAPVVRGWPIVGEGMDGDKASNASAHSSRISTLAGGLA